LVLVFQHEFEGRLSDHIEASRHRSSNANAGVEPARSAQPPAPQKQKDSGFFPGRFSGRTAVITGGASGLGLLTAERIVKEGGKVSLWDLNDAALAAATQKVEGAHTHKVHVGRYPDVAEAAKKSLEALGRIDVLVNCAGITGATVPVQDFPVDNWLQVMDVNLNGIFYCCREIVPQMLAQGYGRIINIASVAGKEGNPKASAYSASKAGVIGFTKSLGKELATSGILVNCITPATFESPILDQLPQSQIDYMRSRIPMGRLGHAEESAALVCWLASEECSFSTAATFDISGGRTTY
jgi:3-oxoacyl-[acyl-carrier protein] reductase